MTIDSIETASIDELRSLQLHRLQDVLRRAYQLVAPVIDFAANL